MICLATCCLVLLTLLLLIGVGVGTVLLLCGLLCFFFSFHSFSCIVFPSPTTAGAVADDFIFLQGDETGVIVGVAEGDGERAAEGEATESVAAGGASLDGVTILGFLEPARRRFECNCVSSVVRSFIGDNCVTSSCGNKFKECDDVDGVGDVDDTDEKEMEVPVVVVLSTTFIFFCLPDPGVLVFFLVDFLRGGFSRLFNFDSKRDTKSIPLASIVAFCSSWPE